MQFKIDSNGFRSCWALENLQPLWAEENLKKGDKVDYNGK
jgi:hypothetical protein